MLNTMMKPTLSIKISSLRDWSGTGTGYTRQQSLFQAAWVQHLSNVLKNTNLILGWFCMKQGVGRNDPYRSFPTQGIL